MQYSDSNFTFITITITIAITIINHWSSSIIHHHQHHQSSSYFIFVFYFCSYHQLTWWASVFKSFDMSQYWPRQRIFHYYWVWRVTLWCSHHSCITIKYVISMDRNPRQMHDLHLKGRLNSWTNLKSCNLLKKKGHKSFLLTWWEVSMVKVGNTLYFQCTFKLGGFYGESWQYFQCSQAGRFLWWKLAIFSMHFQADRQNTTAMFQQTWLFCIINMKLLLNLNWIVTG